MVFWPPVPTWLKRIQQILPWIYGIMQMENISNSRVEESTNETLGMIRLADKTQKKALTNEEDGVSKICDKTEMTEETLWQEWQMVARMMDHISFIVFLLLQATLIIGIVSVIPWTCGNWLFWKGSFSHWVDKMPYAIYELHLEAVADNHVYWTPNEMMTDVI